MSSLDTQAERKSSKDDKEEKELQAAIEAVEKLQRIHKMDEYSHIRSEREKATFMMMMKMNPLALTNIRKEFFAREDALTLDEFLFVINKHLINKNGEDTFVMETPEQREFGANMFELFKDIDINGDGDLEWQEFTSFVVEKANLLNKRQKLASLAHYYDSSSTLDPSADYRHRNDISRIINLPNLNQFAMLEDNKRSIFLFNSRLGKHVATVQTDAAPIAMTPLGSGDKGKNLVVASFSDMTMASYNFESGPSTRYLPTSTWATPGVQMALAYLPANNLLYSGATNGDVYSWRPSDRRMISTLAGHTDICMSLCILKKLNYLASASLDKTISIWDSYTNERLLHLQGHRKGILDMSYSAEYRLLVSCGFEHDALVWSPFVKNLVYRLRGHHGALIGVKCVENTPELITADVHGVFKLWDVRKFECVQTFAANLSGTESKDNSKLCCFEYCKLKPRDARQKEDDCRIYCASKQVLSFDQTRVVHVATTDKAIVFQIFWVQESCSFITVSERNVIVWDALIGSKVVTNENMHENEITAACLDSRKRKMVVGDASGKIYVYNHLNGQQMKTSSGKRNTSAVISLIYLEEEVRFIAGYADGLIRIFDEDPMEDCPVVRTFEAYKMHTELLMMKHQPESGTLVTAGGLDGLIRMWDFGATKCEFESTVAGEKGSVIYVDFLHPLPIIVTSDSLCNITFWGSRGTHFANERICGFMNQTVPSAELEPLRTAAGNEEEAPRRSLAPPVSAAVLDAENEVLASYVEDKGTFENFERVEIGVRKESEAESKRLITEAELRWGKPTAAQCLCWDANAGLLFTADDLGVLRCFDVRKALADITWQPAPQSWRSPGDAVPDIEVAGDNTADGAGNEGVLEIDAVDTTAVAASDKTSVEQPSRKVSVAPSTSSQSQNHLDEEEERDANQWHCRLNVRGFCRNRPRIGNSALPPMPFKDRERDTRYLIPGSNHPSGYHGVDFKWALQAHGDRIVTCLSTQHGCVTSGADMLVKMWTFGGEPLGVLMQSVPVGRRSQKWHLMLDAEAIMRQEDQELDEIIEQVEELAENPELPNIYGMDFATMEPGANAEDFTRSDLRQRIEQTTSKLGINFPVEGEDIDQEEEDLSHLQGSKTLERALHELRSTHVEEKNHDVRREESEMTRKRREKKFEETSRKYEKRAGMRVGPPGTDSGVLDRDIDLHELDVLTEHKGQNGEDVNEGEAKSLVQESSVKSKLGESTSSVNFEDLQSLISSIGLPSSVHGVGEALNEQIKRAAQKGARTQSIAEKCNKYDNWKRLELAMEASSKKSSGGPAKLGTRKK